MAEKPYAQAVVVLDGQVIAEFTWPTISSEPTVTGPLGPVLRKMVDQQAALSYAPFGHRTIAGLTDLFYPVIRDSKFARPPELQWVIQPSPPEDYDPNMIY